MTKVKILMIKILGPTSLVLFQFYVNFILSIIVHVIVLMTQFISPYYYIPYLWLLLVCMVQLVYASHSIITQ